MAEQFDEIKSLIDKTLAAKDNIDEIEEKFVDTVAERVAELMESNMELFFNHMYRMDIDERKIHNVLMSENNSETVYKTIARIIIERQKQRLETKRKYKQDKIEGWDEY
ncbi:MAG TPA: hypothetical protein ENK91_00585 [Bacteroidetes bacterium]|nr:hypothetical protein [Bacteroidota bacterium]